MRRVRIAGAVTFGGLALIIAFKMMVPAMVGVGTAADPAGSVELNGVLYDFSRTHSDFGTVPAGGFGHYAGSTGLWLPANRRPILAGPGYKVTHEWEDSDGRPIAPHLAGVRGGLARETLGLRVSGAIELKGKSSVDAFNSNYGPYGVLGNFGRDALLSTNATQDKSIKIHKKSFVRGDVMVGTGGDPSRVIENKGYISGLRGVIDEAYAMPEPALPEDLEPYQARIDLTGPITLTGDVNPDDDSDVPAVHCGEMRIKDAIITVDGDLVIRCDRKLEIDKSEIKLLPDATLTFYVSDVGGGNGDVKIKGRSLVNVDPGDTTRVSVNALGRGKLEIDKSHVYATIVAPDRELKLDGEGHFYGGFVGASVKADKKSGLHVDRGNATVGTLNFALSVREKVKADHNCTIDSFDSNEGPYGGANMGAEAWVSTNAVQDKEKVELKNRSVIRGDVMIGPFGDMEKVMKLDDDSYVTGSIGQLATPFSIPVVTPPAMGLSVGDRHYSSGEYLLDADLRCKKMKLENGAILNVSGDITLRVDDKLELKEHAEIRLNPGATLTLYVKKEIKIEKHSKLNANTGNPQLVSIRLMSLGGKAKMKLKEHSIACAWVQGARSELKIEDQSEFFGSFAGRKVEVKDGSSMHVDMAYLTNCVDIFDSPGAAGAEGTGGIASASSFDQWYRAVLGTNQSIGHAITLVPDGRGVYTYANDAFYPLDGRLLGDEGERHNNYFTYTIWARFVAQECGGQFVEFEGGDGVWLYVDGKLALDLGGVQPATTQYIELDRLDLTPGKTYSLHLFYAQRHAGDSVFRLRTNVELLSDKTIPNVSAQFD